MFSDKTFTRSVSALAVLVFVAALALYLPRTAVSPQASDGAEYAAAAVSGALVHPSGYPVYLFIADYLVEYFPENPYRALAIFSAVAQAGAAGLLFIVAVILSGSYLVSAAIAAAWIVYEPVVRTATDVEVFALHHLLAGVVVLLSILLYRTKRSTLALAFALGLACGVAGAHHQTILFWAPLVLFSVLASGYRRSGFRGGCGNLLSLLFGSSIVLALYFSLLLRARTGGALVFGAPVDLADLFHYVLRVDYGTFSLHTQNSPDDVSYLWHFFRESWMSSPLFLLAVPLIFGFTIAYRSGLLLSLFVSGCLHFWFLSMLILPKWEEIHGEWIMRFYGLAMLCFALCMAAVSSKLAQTTLSRAGLALLVIGPAFLLAPRALRGGDASNDHVVEIEIKEILSVLPENALFVSSLDRISMGIVYRQLAFQQRPDLIILVEGLVQNPRYRKVLRERGHWPDALESEASVTVSDFAEAALRDGRFIGAYRETRVPDGFDAYPLGSVWQWLPDKPRAGEIVVRIASFCRRWPDGLLYNNGRRRYSTLVADQIFVQPVSEYADYAYDEEVRNALQGAVRYLRAGRARDARESCRIALRFMGESDTFQPGAYFVAKRR